MPEASYFSRTPEELNTPVELVPDSARLFSVNSHRLMIGSEVLYVKIDVAHFPLVANLHTDG